MARKSKAEVKIEKKIKELVEDKRVLEQKREFLTYQIEGKDSEIATLIDIITDKDPEIIDTKDCHVDDEKRYAPKKINVDYEVVGDKNEASKPLTEVDND